MAGIPRESTLMPTIKCSTCGFQVEISSMGEHICTGGGEEGADASLQSGFLGSLLSFAKPQPDRAAAARVPPRVDTSAANRSYATQGQLTPVSVSSGSRSVSPRTPNGPSGRRGPGRTDDYFAPKIAGEFDSPPQAGRRPGGYGGFAEADVYDVDQPYGSSPNKAGALLQRMNSMAPGPFESGARRPGAAAARNAFPTRNNPSADSSRDESPRPSNNTYGADNRPGTSAGRPASPGGASLPRLPRGNGYEGFGKPQNSQEDFEPTPFGAGNRAETFPRPRIGVDAPARTPSAPGPRPGRLRRPSDASTGVSGAAERSRAPPTGMMRPDTSRGPPPRTSIVRPRAASKDGSGSVRAVDLAREFGLGNPFHSPSGSLSSSVSTSSQSTHPKQPSSRSSPARSPDSRPPRPTETSRFDDLMSDLQSSMQDVESKRLPPIPTPSTTASSSLRAVAGLPSQGLGFAKNGGRMDAAQSPWSTESRPRTPLASSDSPRGRDGPARGQRDRAQRNPDLAVPSTRGDCRACHRAITGKSISSADGRLTGRYHKACFVCRACQAPFSSSTFYVIDDAPYCELHYHKLNGSLCGSCGVGIEGQYLEDESLKKHHPGCFRCGDCGKVLQDGYFEVNGQAFCERDAWKRVQQPLPASDGARQPPAMPESRLGLPPGPGPRGGPGARGFGLPSGNRLGPRPRMEKRMTRLGMM